MILARYIKAHPGVLAAHVHHTGVTLAGKLKARAAAKARARKNKKRHTKPANRRKKASGTPAGAKRGSKKKKAAPGSGWRRAEMIVGALAIGGLAVFLIGSSVLGGPRARARARARARKRARPVAAS